MNTAPNTYSPVSNNRNVITFQCRTVKPVVKRVNQSLSSEKNILNTENIKTQSFIDKLKNLLGLKPKENPVKEIESLKSQIKDIKSEIEITKSQIGEINKRTRHLNEWNAYYTRQIEELETRNNGSGEVGMLNYGLANVHSWCFKTRIKKNNIELLELKEQHSQLKKKKSTLNIQLLEVKNKLTNFKGQTY